MPILPTGLTTSSTGHVNNTNQVHSKLNNAWYDVKADFGAEGNGSTNDAAAIQAAIDACSAAGGGTVFFPRGNYLVNSQINLPSYVHLLGSEPASRYWGYTTASPPSACKITVGASFAGANNGLIYAASTAWSIKNLTLHGNNVGTVNGLVCGSAGTEHNALLDSIAIINFGGNGITGSLWATRFNNFFIGGCGQWGINPTTFFADCHFINGYIAGCLQGQMLLGGTGSSGFCDFTNIRFERGGWNSSTVSSPYSSTAVGIRITRANNCRFVSCSTDANAGNGLEIALTRAAAGDIYDIDFVACTFKRDGFGNMSTQPNASGIKLSGFDNAGSRVDLGRIRFISCQVLVGKATDDATAPAYTHPKYALDWGRTANIQFIGGYIEGAVAQRYSSASGTEAGFTTWNWQPYIDLPQSSIKWLPRGSTASRPTNMGTGAFMFFDETLNKPIFTNNGGASWRDAAGTTV